MMAEQIEDNDVLVYSFSTCPFCKKAKAALEEENIEYTAYELDQMGKEGYQIRAELAEVSLLVPMYFDEGQIQSCSNYLWIRLVAPAQSTMMSCRILAGAALISI